MTRSVGIIGGGIAGLGAAIAMRKAGWDVTVYERAPELTEVGAGIVLSANGLRALDALGVGDEIRARVLPDRPGTVRNQRGRVLINARVGDFVGGIAAMHRAELISVLAAAIPAECLRLGAPVISVDAEGRVDTAEESTRHDLVIAADGVFSRTRTMLWPDDKPVRCTGIRAWRWIVDGSTPDGVGLVWGREGECGVMPMADGRTLMWAGGPVASLDHFLDWPDPIPAMIAAVDRERIVANELLEIAVPRRLWRGRVALIGDAAHAMRPTLGQGACLALEDAVAVAACAPDLSRYSALRRRRVAALNVASRYGTRLSMPGGAALAAVRDTALRMVPDALAVGLLRASVQRL